MRYLDIETPKIRNPVKKVNVNIDKLDRFIYDYDSLDIIDMNDE